MEFRRSTCSYEGNGTLNGTVTGVTKRRRGRYGFFGQDHTDHRTRASVSRGTSKASGLRNNALRRQMYAATVGHETFNSVNHDDNNIVGDWTGRCFNKNIDSEAWIGNRATNVDFSLYCGRVGPFNNFIKSFLLVLVQIQMLFTALLPGGGIIWNNDANIRGFIERAAYFPLTNIPQSDATVCWGLRIALWVLMYGELLIYVVLRYWYRKRRAVPSGLVKFRNYVALLIHIILCPMHMALNGLLVGEAFLISSTNTNVISLLTVITTAIAFIASLGFIHQGQCCVKYDALLFPSWGRITAQLNHIVRVIPPFLVYACARAEKDIPTMLFTAALFRFFYGLWEMWGNRWMSARMIIGMRTLGIGTGLTYFFIGVNLRTNGVEEHMMFWVIITFLILFYGVNFIIVKIRHARINRIMSDRDAVKSIKSESMVLDYLRVAFVSGNREMLDGAHALEIVDAFPESQEIHMFYAIFSLGFTTCPVDFNVLVMDLDSTLNHSTDIANLFLELEYYVGPLSQVRLEKYSRGIAELHDNFGRVVRLARMVYGIAFVELTMNLPGYALEFTRAYDALVRQLRKFTQRYPGSASGEMFIRMLECVFPRAKEIEEAICWHNARLGHSRSVIDAFPNTLSRIVEDPGMLHDMEALYDPLPVKYDVNEVSALAASVVRKDTTHLKVRGLMWTHIYRWHTIILGLLTLGVWAGGATLILEDDVRHCEYVTAVNQISIFTAQNYLFNANFFFSVLTFFNDMYDDYGRNGGYNARLTDQRSELRTSLVCLSSGMCEDNRYTSVVLDEANAFFLQYLDSGSYESSTRAFAIFGTTLYHQQIQLNDSSVMAKNDLAYAWNIVDQLTDITDDIMDDLSQLVAELSATSTTLEWGWRIFLIFYGSIITLLFVADVVIMASRAHRAFLQFLRALRQTRKSSINEVQKFLTKFENVTGISRRGHAATDSSEVVHRLFYFNAAVITCTIFIVIAVIMFLLFSRWYDLTITNMATVSAGAREFFRVVHQYSKAYQKFMYVKEDRTEQQIDKARSSMNDMMGKALNMVWDVSSENPMPLCPVHTLHDQMFAVQIDGRLFESVVTEYFSLTSRQHSIASERTSEKLCFDGVKMYYEDLAPGVITIMERVLDPDDNGLTETWVLYTGAYAVGITLVCILVLGIMYGISVLDRPFLNLIRIVERLPKGSLSSEAVSIMEGRTITACADDQLLDNSVFDGVFEISPDVGIVIDQSVTVIRINMAAEALFEVPDEAPGSKLFDSLSITLTEIDTGLDLKTIIDKYMFGGRTLVSMHTMTGKVNDNIFTVSTMLLPLLNDSVDVAGGANLVAILIHDVTTDLKLEKELRESEDIPDLVNDGIIPKQLQMATTQQQRYISFDIPECTSCMIELCGTAEVEAASGPKELVAAMAKYVSLFDQFAAKYETLTPVKFSGTKYFIVSGIFSQGIDPFVYILEMIRFCFDIIETITKQTGETRSEIECKIGICYAGPAIAGITGSERPFLDIYGPVVDATYALTESGVPEKIHVNEDLYHLVERYQFPITPLGDGTYLIGFCSSGTAS